MRNFIITCLTILFLGKLSNGKPTHQGPCVGPDCFHGQLMHGDKEAGIDHEKEDTYLRIKEELAAGQEDIKPEPPEKFGVGQMEIDIGAQAKEDVKKGPIQPIDGEIMMHGEGKPHGHEEKKLEEMENVKRGPVQPVDGEAMMHGGEHKPHDHLNTDSDNKIEESGKKHGPGGEEYWHGVLNHGDAEPGKEHHHNEDRQPVKYDFNAEDIKAIEGVGQLLSKIDLDEILKKNEKEYEKHQSEQRKEKSGEGSLWEQLNEVRERYLSFGGQVEETDEVRDARFNPMLSEWESEDLPDEKTKDEDDIVHNLEVLGNTSPLRNVHNKKHRKEYEKNTHVTHDES